MKARPKPRAKRAENEEAAPKLVYVHAPVLFARIVARAGDAWTVDLGTGERILPADPAVDPELLEQARARGERVLVDSSGEPCIVGVVSTRRAIEIDSDGKVDARVRSFHVDAEEEILLKTPGAFVRALGREVEVYGERVITRARNMAKILAAMIKLN
ncbi:MAG: hypothetical protein IT378_06580 [Sandaracinaceae bacterium]|nr:hypothetical protein [Sandaracinaceae bacterium]